MSNTYEEYNQSMSPRSFIVFPGQLVGIRQNCFEQTSTTGIIIECVYPDFGLGQDKWLVFTNGKLDTLESFKLWPVEEI